MRPIRIVLVVLLAAVIGVTVFGTLALRRVTLVSVESSDAMERFDRVRAEHPGEPALEIDADGNVKRRPTAGTGDRPARLKVLAFRARDAQLAEADIPYWFVKLKRPALALVMRRAGVDLDEIGLSSAVLDAHGPGILIDNTGRDGDRVLVWLE